MNRLAKLLSSRARAEIFRLLFNGAGEELHAREIERRCGLNDSTLRQELRKLVRLELVQSRRDSNRLYYRAKTENPLYLEIRNLVLKTSGLSDVLKSALVLLYWRMGKRIRRDILKEKRADYGVQIVNTVSTQLVQEFGTGFAEKNLRRMIQFAEAFPDEQIVATLSRQLGWSHFVAIIPLDAPLNN